MSEGDGDGELERQDHDSLIRDIAAAPAVPIPADLATLVLLEPGVVVDGVFRIAERLGAGGMGVVYAARDLELDREVAIKLMRLDRGAGELGARLPEVFAREARATAKLNHPNIVTLHQFGNWNGLFYLVLERLRGETLHARMAREAVPLAEGLAIIEQVARALVHTHAAGVTHRDLKPQNVFLTTSGLVKVLDFGVSGLARAPSEPAPVWTRRSVTWRSTLAHAGTPGYMAPEQWQGRAHDARTDLWAVGVMLYQLVTGALPFALGPLDEHARPAAALAGLPAAAATLGPLVARCLAVQPGDRLGDASELAAALHEIRSRLAGHPARGRPRHRRTAILAATAVASGAIAIAALRPSQTGPACGDAAARLAGVWDAATRGRLGGRFAADRVGWSELRRTLEVYAGQWTAMADAACRSGSAPAQRCLDDRLVALQRLTGRLATLDLLAAVGASHALPPLADCADPGRLAQPAAHGDRSADPAGAPASVVPLAVTVAGHGLDIVHGAVFVDDDLVVVGFATPGATVSGDSVEPSAPRPRGGFAARIARDGALRWSRTFHEAFPLAIARGRGGAVVIAGHFAANARIGDIALSTSQKDNGRDGFVASLDAATGEPAWVRTSHASNTAVVRGLATDPDGNVYASGDFGGTADFGGATAFDAAAQPEEAPFVASWQPGGRLRWVVAGSGTSTSRVRGIAASADAVVIAAKISGAGSFGGRRLGLGRCVIARLDPATGGVRWLRQEAGQAGQCTADGIALAGDRIAVGGRQFHDPGGAWIAEFALADGALRWVRRFGAEMHDAATALAFAPDGTLAVAGNFRSAAMTIDGVTVMNHGNANAYVLRLGAGGVALAAIELASAEDAVARWIAHAPGDRIAVGGRFVGGMTVADRELRGAGYNDGFVVELQLAVTAPRPPAGAASP